MTRKNVDRTSMRELNRKLKTAQQRLANRQADTDSQRLLHELEIHQIELEMQNVELRDSQQCLEESRSQYVDLYDFAPVGYCTINLKGYIQEINLTAAALFEKPRKHLIGTPFQVAARVNGRQFHEHMQRCIEKKGPVTSDLTLDLLRGGPRVVRVICKPIVNDTGVVTAYRMALIDITEEKQFENEFRLLSDLGAVFVSPLDYAETLEASARVLVPEFADLLKVDLLNENGQIDRILVLFADAGKQNALSEKLKQFSPQPGWKTPQAKVIESGKPMLLEAVPDAARDRIAQDEVHAHLLRTAGIRSMMVTPLTVRGRTIGAVTFATAESGRRYSTKHLQFAQTISSRFAMAIENARLSAERIRAISARDAILAVVSHDLRNPLNAIRLKAQLMLRSPENQSRTDGAFVLRRADEIARLIQDLLDIASIEAGRLRLEKSQQAVGPLVKEAVEASAAQAAQKSLQLESEYSAADGSDIDCDPGRVQQVLSNLIGNAIKFTEPGGSIHVRVARRTSEVWFSVADSGAGISTADLPHLFDRFTRISKNARQGTGLGLSIAKGIVEAHGGRIWAESQVGVGSTFYFTLPLGSWESEALSLLVSPRQAQPVTGGGLQVAPPTNSSRSVVLVVDDDNDTRDMLAKTLEHEGYEVVAQANGAEALEYLRQAACRPVCILLDLVMPVMDGWTFLRERAGNPDLKPIPVIVISGSKDVKEQVIASQATFLQKPLSLERLTEAMRRSAQLV